MYIKQILERETETGKNKNIYFDRMPNVWVLKSVFSQIQDQDWSCVSLSDNKLLEYKYKF